MRTSAKTAICAALVAWFVMAAPMSASAGLMMYWAGDLLRQQTKHSKVAYTTGGRVTQSPPAQIIELRVTVVGVSSYSNHSVLDFSLNPHRTTSQYCSWSSASPSPGEEIYLACFYKY
jgi:hypothetical protein